MRWTWGARARLRRSPYLVLDPKFVLGLPRFVPGGDDIEGPLNLKLQDAGTKVPYLDTQLLFDPVTRLLSWNHYDMQDHIAAFVGTHTFPHPLSRLHRRCKVGTYTGFLHRINRATTSNSGFVRKAVKQGRAMISHGYELRDICDRVRTFSAFDRRKGWWPKVRGRIIRRLKGRQNT